MCFSCTIIHYIELNALCVLKVYIRDKKKRNLTMLFIPAILELHLRG